MNVFKIPYTASKTYGLGLFAITSRVLTQLHRYDRIQDPEKSLFVEMRNWDYGNAKQDYDIWSPYWKPIGCSADKLASFKNKNITRLDSEPIWGNFFTYRGLHKYIDYEATAKKYFALHDDIQNNIDKFVLDNELSKKKTLAIHYRGTDKIDEFPRVPEDYVAAVAADLINQHQYEQVYICTDEHSAMNELKQNITKFVGRIPIIESESFRTLDADQPIYKVNRDEYRKDAKFNVNSCHQIYDEDLTNYKKGLDVIFDVYTMAKCQGFLRCMSNVSDWVILLSDKIEKTWFFHDHRNPQCSATFSWT